MRSKARTTLEAAGHRVIDANGYPQAQLLLSNGVLPDLVLIESEGADPDETGSFARENQGTDLCLIGESEWARALPGGCHLLPSGFRSEDLTRIAESRVAREGSLPSAHPAAHPAAKAHPARGRSGGSRAFRAGSPTVIEELGEDGFFLAASEKMLEIHRQVRLIADADVNVLILGESGTGKEVIAQLIHRHSQRSGHRFLKVNCAALPSELLESELFGHQKGAFTGAIRDRSGKFEQANRGTLLLDEIGEMSASMQAKLLHVLQDGEFTRLGGQDPVRADVRVLAATNVPIESALREKRFREDIYYRLSVFTISIPPLRERREEIPYLIEETIRRIPPEMKSGREQGFSPRLMEAALAYDWHGNLRELRNFVTRAVIMGEPEMAVSELEAKIEAGRPEPEVREPEVRETERLEGTPAHCASMRSIMRSVRDRTEAQLIQNALEASGWNRRRAAQYLRISYRGLLYKIQQYHLTPRLPGELSQPPKPAAGITRGTLM